jgi:hypothetical protein
VVCVLSSPDLCVWLAFLLSPIYTILFVFCLFRFLCGSFSMWSILCVVRLLAVCLVFFVVWSVSLVPWFAMYLIPCAVRFAPLDSIFLVLYFVPFSTAFAVICHPSCLTCQLCVFVSVMCILFGLWYAICFWWCS